MKHGSVDGASDSTVVSEGVGSGSGWDEGEGSEYGLMALFTLLIFAAYLHPSEGLALTVSQLVPPVAGHTRDCQHW